MQKLVPLLLLVPLAVPAAAPAKAPRTAKIDVGKGMAGAKLRQQARFADPFESRRVVGEPFEDWGRWRDCFELNCRWSVSGGGSVYVQFSGAAGSIFVRGLRTTAKRWRTSRGIHVGSSATAVERAYDRRVKRIRTCRVGDFGAEMWGYRLGHRRSHTFFQLTGPNGTKVRSIWIGEGRLPFSAGC